MPIGEGVVLGVQNALSADRQVALAPSASAHRVVAGRALLCFALVILFAAVVYIAAVYGFRAVVRCEMENNRALAHDHGAMSQIAMSDACGF